MIDIMKFGEDNRYRLNQLQQKNNTGEDIDKELRDQSLKILDKLQNINTISLIVYSYRKHLDWIQDKTKDFSIAPLLYICGMCLNLPSTQNIQNTYEEIKDICDQLLDHYALSLCFRLGLEKSYPTFNRHQIQKYSIEINGSHGYEYQIKELIKELYQQEIKDEPLDLESLIENKRSAFIEWCKTQQGTAQEATDMIKMNLVYPLTDLTLDLSCNFGDNKKEYLLPIDKNVLSSKPFIILDDICISPFIIGQGYNLIAPIWDRWLIENNNNNPIRTNNYGYKKGEWLENKTYKICRELFGEENCYLNTYFKEKEDKIELDLVVVYGSFILYFECKSGGKKNSFLGKAGVQINRFYKQCQSDTIHIYPDAKPNSDSINIKHLEDKFIFIPCIITMESFDYLSGNSSVFKNYLKTWKELDIIPMIFQIFDLETIAKILDKDYLFVDYLLQKNFLHTDNKEDHCIIQDGNEIDQLAYYVQRGQIPHIKFYDIPATEVAVAVDMHNQEHIDNYFIKRSDGTSSSKPQRKHDPIAEDFLAWLETSSPFEGSLKKLAKQWFLAYYNCLHQLNQQFSLEYAVENDSMACKIFPSKENPQAGFMFFIITPDNQQEIIKESTKLMEQVKKEQKSYFMMIFYYKGIKGKTFDIRSSTPLTYPYDILVSKYKKPTQENS